jgi:Rrf2 family iron-sulfur cluster assembly transcriptional regulator
MLQELKMTSRGRYAVMAMVELAKASELSPKPLAEIAAQSNISLSYLEQLIAGLRRSGLVKSYRGPGGGYILARAPSDITIAEILLAAEDSTPARRQAASSAHQQKAGDCVHTHHLWEHIGKILHVTLNGVSLQDILEQRLASHPNIRKIIEIAG